MTHLTSSVASGQSLPVPLIGRLMVDAEASREAQLILPVDPLDPDGPDDRLVVLSHRQVTRLVFVAAETGARFTRDRSAYDPAAWMTAPRKLFHGLSALNACTERDMFMRALVLHGVCPAYDMLPDDMDRLLSAEHGMDLVEAEVQSGSAIGTDLSVPLFPKLLDVALFTASLVDETESGVLHIFFAAIADSEGTVREQLARRVGGFAFHEARVRRGFDPSEPIALSVVSEVMAELLRQIESAPRSPLSAGFSLFIEHRFDA